MTDKANLLAKFNQIQEFWTPKIIADTNGQLVKLAKLKGEFIWHNHENEDELFYVVKGELLLRFKNREIQLKEGDLYVVPAGEDHLPIAREECWVMLVEPAALNTPAMSMMNVPLISANKNGFNAFHPLIKSVHSL